MRWTLCALVVFLVVCLSGSFFESPILLVEAHRYKNARRRTRLRKHYRDQRRNIPGDPKLGIKENQDLFLTDVEDAVNDDDDDDDKQTAAENTPPLTDMSNSFLIPVTGSMSCMKDTDDTYCLLKDINPIPSVQVSKLSDLQAVTKEMLDDYCMMNQYPRCSRMLQSLVVEPDTATSKTLPRYAACARHTDGSYCVDVFSKISETPDFDRCWNQVASGVCSPSCSKAFRTMLETLGCCAHASTVLLGQIGRTDALHALHICPGLDLVSVAVRQSCGGLSKLGPSKVAQEISLTLDFPCQILDFAESTLEDLFRSELADLISAEAKHISSVRMSCSTKPVSSPMTYTEKSHLNLNRRDGTIIHATHVTFRITAGFFSDEIASNFIAKLKRQVNSFYMKELTAAVRALLVDAPIVGVLGAPVISQNSAVATLGHALCDPIKFMDVVEKCWGVLKVYMDDSEDADLEWDERNMCDPAAPCARALERFGVENLPHCAPTWASGGVLGLAYLSVMCLKNENNVPCARFLRDDDTTLACTLMTQEMCLLEPKCLWDVTFLRCSAAPNRTYLDGFCGKCYNALLDVSSMLAPLNNEIPPLASSTLTTACMRSNTTYCLDVITTNPNLLQSKPGMSKNVAPSRVGPSTAPGIVLSGDLCGATDQARCHRMALVMSAQRSRISAESCTMHPLLCLTEVEYAIKQDVLVETMLEYGCEKEKSGEKICAERIQTIAPDVLTCYDLILKEDKCSEPCGELWKKEIQNLGCCVPLAHAYLESTDEDQTPMDRRGLHRLKECIPTIDDLIHSNPSCPASTSKPISKTLKFSMDCALLNEEITQIFVEKVPDDIASAAGIAGKFVTVKSVSCAPGSESDYGLNNAHIQKPAYYIASPNAKVIVVTYEVNTRTQEETNAASNAIDSFVRNHGELMWLEVAISNALGQAFDLNHA